MDFLFPTPTPEVIPPSVQIAGKFLESLNAEIARIAGFHISGYRAFWDSPVSPDEILEAMGPLATRFLASAGASADYLFTLAQIAGKPITDLVPMEYIVPRRAFIPHEDGTATIEPPAEGYDAWGREIID